MKENIDLAIIATSSKIRYKITKELKPKKLKNIVFEKVLFQKVDTINAKKEKKIILTHG